MQRKLIVCAMVGLMLLASENTMAGNRTDATTLTVGGGYFIFADKRNLNNTAVLPSLALAYNFNEQWAIEGAYGAFKTNYKPKNLSGNASGDLYTIAGLYRFTAQEMFQPYISAGLGVLHINPNGTDANNLGNINAGIGAQLFFDDSIALRSEVRDIYTMVHGKNDVTITFGVSFLMGGNSQQQTPVVYKSEVVEA